MAPLFVCFLFSLLSGHSIGERSGRGLWWDMSRLQAAQDAAQKTEERLTVTNFCKQKLAASTVLD